MSSLAVTNLSFSYCNAKPVISDLSVEFKSGETWAVIGKNGTGKSTLIRCLAGLEKVQRATVCVDSADILDMKPVALAKICSYVPQASLHIPPAFTVAEYVLMGRYPYCGFPVKYTRTDKLIVEDALAMTDTAMFADRSMKTLSGGELQRVFIAGAVAQQTSIMFLDEPVSFLDPMHQEMIHATLERIHAQFGTTLITVTHDINSALQQNSHILALGMGCKLFSGTTGEFLLDAESLLYGIYGIRFEKATGEISSCSFLVPRLVGQV